MTRLPFLDPDDLGDDGRALWDVLTETRGSGLVGPEGGLMGPFNAWLHAPEVGTRLAELGTVLRYGTAVDRRLLEIAIITIGARYEAEFEWWAHSRMARSHGVADDVIDAIAHHDSSPPFTQDDERIVHAVATQLGANGRIDDATYASAREVLGDRGVVEIVSLCGYYTLVCFTLNAFEVALPPGESPTWG